MGDLITCPSCHGWTPDETGMFCHQCSGQGVIWDDDAVAGEIIPRNDDDESE